jgi:cell wall-associated NlpC family hydrolase
MKKGTLLSGIIFVLFVLTGCSSSRNHNGINAANRFKSDIELRDRVAPVDIDTKKISPDKLVDFAETLQGIKYVYGSANKDKGFDCSGFVWYVFSHFNIKVPRTAVEYTNAGKKIKPQKSKRGDIILFTGSNSKSRVVGHMGIVTKSSKKSFQFIHSASGGNKGVMISNMSSYYYRRFVKIIRVF